MISVVEPVPNVSKNSRTPSAVVMKPSFVAIVVLPEIQQPAAARAGSGLLGFVEVMLKNERPPKGPQPQFNFVERSLTHGVPMMQFGINGPALSTKRSKPESAVSRLLQSTQLRKILPYRRLMQRSLRQPRCLPGRPRFSRQCIRPALRSRQSQS